MISRVFQYQIVSPKLLKNMDGSSLGCIEGKMLMVGSVRSKCYQGTKLVAEAVVHMAHWTGRMAGSNHKIPYLCSPTRLRTCLLLSTSNVFALMLNVHKSHIEVPRSGLRFLCAKFPFHFPFWKIFHRDFLWTVQGLPCHLILFISLNWLNWEYRLYID